MALLALATAGCGGGGATSGSDGKGGKGGKGGSGSGSSSGSATIGDVDGGVAGTGACDDLFAPDRITTWEVELSADVWTALQTDMVSRVEREAAIPPQDYNPYHPVQSLRVAGETVSNVMIRLKGQSSWLHAIAGWQQGMPIPKMQFAIAFDQVDDHARFHGLKKVELDMPHNDESMLRQRLALAFLRDDLEVPAQCANSARLVVNGEYYGLYTNLERLDKSFLKRVFPGQADGDLWDAGWTLETNTSVVDHPRQCQFWGLPPGGCGLSPPAMMDADAMAMIIDLEASMTEWAGEAMITDGDGYWGGRHNWFLYDHPTRGFIWLPHDLDATLSWIARNDVDPVYWWEIRTVSSNPDPHYLGVVNNPNWLPKYIEAVRRAYRAYDTATVIARVDGWAAQIAEAAAQDTHKPFTMAEHDAEVSMIRANAMARPAYVSSWLACIDGAGTDADGDGTKWCRDCNDNDASRAPGLAEICGDGIDQNCNGMVDELCPPPT
jgi:hypothetical protein